MTKRTCTVDGCSNPYLARGLCYTHYNRTRGQGPRYRRVTVSCGYCGNPCEKRAGGGYVDRYCSDRCKGDAYSEQMTTRCHLPRDHPVHRFMRDVRVQEQRSAAAARQKERKAARLDAWRTERECPGCACWFTPLYTPTAVYCSRRCAKRIERRLRRLSDRHIGWVWSEYMRIAERFNYRCAYCGVKPPRLDPDHVIPLSKGGPDSATNLLPSCPPCNSSKSAMTLTEWAEWRRSKDLRPVKTAWSADDGRYHHLTHAVCTA